MVLYTYSSKTIDEFREDVRIMCNLSTGIEERATERATKNTTEKIILNMYESKFSVEQISMATQKSKSEIEKIIKNNEPVMA